MLRNDVIGCSHHQLLSLLQAASPHAHPIRIKGLPGPARRSLSAAFVRALTDIKILGRCNLKVRILLAEAVTDLLQLRMRSCRSPARIPAVRLHLMHAAIIILRVFRDRNCSRFFFSQDALHSGSYCISVRFSFACSVWYFASLCILTTVFSCSL